MTNASQFVPEWTKVIARAWVDPAFRSHLEANPDQVLASYGIHQVGGYNVDDLAGHISVVDTAGGTTQKPHMDGDHLVIPLPPAPKNYDHVVDPDSVQVAGAGTATSIMEREEAMAQPGGLQVGSKEYSAGGQTIASTNITSQEEQVTQNQSHSIPSVPSLDDDDDDEDGAEGAEAGEDAGADAGEAVGEAAVEGGADAAADAAAAAVALCA